jgi:hypothetical protein
MLCLRGQHAQITNLAAPKDARHRPGHKLIYSSGASDARLGKVLTFEKLVKTRASLCGGRGLLGSSGKGGGSAGAHILGCTAIDPQLPTLRWQRLVVVEET